MARLAKIRFDTFLLSILTVVLLATFFPCEGRSAEVFKILSTIAITLLFFMHGAKLSRSALMNGIRHWRLHLTIFFSTFILFPLLGLGLGFLVPRFLTPTVYQGFLFLCALPGTVQAAIAFTSMGKGNVPAAIFSSALSSILGVFLSPLLVNLLMHYSSDAMHFWQTLYSIILQLIVPFILGHLSRPLIGTWIDKHRLWIGRTDRTSILLVVYTAFSNAVIAGLWGKLGLTSLIMIVGYSSLILLLVIGINMILARKILKFPLADEVALVFCGSKKSLVNGIPMANVLFSSADVGLMLLPLMIFHQTQLLVCAFLAQRYAKKINSENDQKLS